MTPEMLANFIDLAESDEVQSSLKNGFEKEFITSVLAQYKKRNTLSDRQQEILVSIVGRIVDGDEEPEKKLSRRYEGFGK